MENLSVGMLVQYKNKFLLLERKNNILEPCKGHVEKDESYEETMKRELFEETNIKNFEIIDKIGLLKFSFIKNDKKVNRNIVYFHIKVFDDNVKLSEEHKNFYWLEKEEFLKKLTFNDVRELLKNYLEKNI